jgi:Flp pilus assembly protein TadG
MVTLVTLFLRSRRGVAALEFALIAPLLIALFLGGFELTRYMNAIRRITYLANSVAEMIAQNTTGSVNMVDIQFAQDSTMLIFPQVLSDSKGKGIPWGNDMTVDISAVDFTPTVSGCTSNCTYTAKVHWSTAGYRPCSAPLSAVSDTAAPTATTLPSDVFGPGSLIVVDVVYTYTPVVATNIFGAMTIRHSAYLQPRYVASVNYDGSVGWAAQACY